jgi:dCMP deaminase
MRQSKHKWYLNVAEQIAQQSTCLRRNFGAVIVNHDQIIATGYGGAPRGTENCIDIKACYRDIIGARRGENYEFCRAAHAEQNAIIQARRLDMFGATLYLVGLDAKTNKRLMEAEPCRICKRLIINANIEKVVVGLDEDKTITHSVSDWVKENLRELQKENGGYVPVQPPRNFGKHTYEERERQLISKYLLSDAIVIQTTSYEEAKHTVGRAAARFFTHSIKSGCSVALSCGETVLSMLEFLPYLANRTLTINQMSVEANPLMIHQAPATLVGLLRSKVSMESKVYGLQLPPFDLADSFSGLRAEFTKTSLFTELRKDALNSDYVFLGLGSAGPDSASFWAMVHAASGIDHPESLRELGILGEINNQVFDELGKDCSDKIPELAEHVVNILTLDDIITMAKNPNKHKVVLVATGPTKKDSMRVALQAGYANVLITGKEDADSLLEGV